MSYGGLALTRPTSIFLSSHSIECQRGGAGARYVSAASSASTAWGTANIGLWVPVIVPTPYTARFAWWENGATANGTVDVGLYDEAFNRLISCTPQTQSGTSAIQSFDITDTTILPGRYYIALSSSSATATFLCQTAAPAAKLASIGCFMQTAVATLPNPAVPVLCTHTLIPEFGFTDRTLV